MERYDNRDFTENKLYTIVNYIYWILISSVLFIVSNALFVFVLFVSLFSIKEQLLPFHIVFIALLVVAIPMGPSFCALYSVMRKIVLDKQVSVVKEFFKGYRQNFKQALLAWVLILFLIALFTWNYYIIVFHEFASFLIFPLYMFTSLLLCTAFYVFPLISQYYMRLIDVFRISLYFTLKHFNTTIMILIVFVFGGYLFTLFPTITFVFIPGAMALIVMLLVTKLFGKVQLEHKKEDTQILKKMVSDHD
ncbi:hypothetical protein BTS2_0755 [Bacillus sp. TS-2]|nr:hypothetical protein BTS2_0755 [Bacillus sp. TS-2]